MEIYRLKSFAAILREKNLTRAAETLHISQSALSSQLKQLEEELGVPLFHRVPRGMEPTDAGRELAHLVEGVLEAAEKLRLRAVSLQQSGGETIHIGLNADPSFLRIAAVNRRMSLLHGALNVIFLTSQTVRTPQLLRQGQLDLAFFYGDLADPDIEHQQLAQVRFCVVIPSHLARDGATPDWAAVASLPWVWVGRESPPYAAVLEQFSSRRLHPNKAVNADDEFIVKELVMDGQGVGLMREDEARPLAEAGRVVLWPKGWMVMALRLGWMAAQGEKKRIRAAREAIAYVWRASGGHQEKGLEGFCY